MSDDENDDIEMKGSYNDRERTSNIGPDLETYIMDLGGSISTKLFKSDIERFVIDIDSITRELIENNILSSGNLKILLDNMINLDKPQYKNATAYILGYIASDGGREITEKSYKNALQLTVKRKGKNNYIMSDTSVQSPDIIRYAVLWTNIKNKI
jgi:hypothetical protein